MNSFALLLTSSPSTNTGSMWILTQGIMAIAKKVDAALTPSAIGDGASLLDFVFLLTVVIMFMTLGFEVATAVRKAFSEGDGVARALLDGKLVKRWLRFAVFLFLGSVFYVYFYSADAGMFSRTPASFSSFTTGVIVPLAGDNEISAPIEKLEQVAETLKGASSYFGAWNLANATRMEIAQAQAAGAAEDYWDTLNPEDKGGTDGSANAPPDDGSNGVIDEAYEKLMSVVKFTVGAIQSYFFAGLLTLANLGLDVYATRVIMMNGLFLVIAFKMAFAFLPVALVLAFFPGTTGILVGCVRTLVICTISLHVLNSASATLLDPANIARIAATASEVPDAANNSMTPYVKKVYEELSSTQPGFDKKDFMEAVATGLNSSVNQYYLNAEGFIWAPARIMMMLAMMIAFIGKIAVVISDSLNGSMSFHRG